MGAFEYLSVLISIILALGMTRVLGASDWRIITLLIMPNVDAANITYNALRVTSGGGITVGGILRGTP